jgi:N-acetylmuramoyl-L-alanine amidase
MNIAFETPAKRLPADGAAMMPIRLKLFDADWQPVWDGTMVYLQTDRGAIGPATLRLKNGGGMAYFQAGTETGPAQIVATADNHSDTLTLDLTPPGERRVLSGVVVDDSTEARLPAAMIIVDDSLRAATDENGGFFMENLSPGIHKLAATAKGYANENKNIVIDANRSAVMPVRLKANLSGILHNEPIILDAAFGGSETGDAFGNGLNAAAANFDLVTRLADTLRWAGANVMLVREDQNDLPVAARIEKVNAMPEGWYLKLSYRYWNSDSILAQSTIYPANRVGEEIAVAINAAFAHLPRCRAVLRQNTAVPEVNLTNKTALEVIIKCRAPMIATRDLFALFEGIVSFKRTAALEREE